MREIDSKFPFKMYSLSGNGALVFPRVSETQMEIVEVTAGNVKIQIGTECIDASVGDFLYVPHGLVYRADATDGYASIRGMIFDASIIEANMVSYETEILYMFYVQSENKIKIFKEGHPIHSILSRCMSDSYEEYLAKDVCYKLPIRANIYLSMTALLRNYCTVKNESERIVYHNVLRLRPVINYISEHFSEKIYVEKLADIIMVSPDYFTKMFKDSIGKTPVDYINGLRVNRSMKLLIETDKSIADISEDIGFCNANYFHKIFKQYMEVSPLAYRKSAK
ncbi:MAG: helix-turn-helix transcriptional regulator [Clostridia bacterium]|nr:helix-turn-helix transcriptional regulator [Clostridia bacterium]